jgi:uncharacterized membrane protein YdjX (TVP38/TMEM64 family)
MPEPDPPPRDESLRSEGKPRTFFQRLGPAGPVALVFLFGPPLGLLTLGLYAGTVAEWFRSHGEPGLILYVVLFAVLAGTGLLPTHIQCALAGYAFGIVDGSAVTMVGILGASVIGYEIARRASGDRVLQLLAEKPKWRALRDALVGDGAGHGFWKTLGLVTLVRIPPNSPFALTNLLLASVKVARAPFLLGTVIGIAPRAILAVYVGASIATMQRSFSKESLSEGGMPQMFYIGLGVTIVVVVAIVWIAQRTLKRITAGSNGRSGGEQTM